MPRNLDRRVEAMLRVTDQRMRARLEEILTIDFADDVLAWTLEPDGTWRKVETVVGIESQVRFQELAVGAGEGPRPGWLSDEWARGRRCRDRPPVDPGVVRTVGRARIGIADRRRSRVGAPGARRNPAPALGSAHLRGLPRSDRGARTSAPTCAGSGSEFGELRDIEVQRDRLRAHAGLLPPAEAEAARRVIRRLDADREATRFDLLSMLAQARYGHVRDTLAAAAAYPAFTDAAFRRASKALKPVVRARWKKIRRSVRKAGATPSDEALHLIRVRAKRCRYAAEACEPVYGKRARRLARAMADVQDVLGEHHDAVVASAWLAKTAHECSPSEAYAIGMLAQIERGCRGQGPGAVPRHLAPGRHGTCPRLDVRP